MVSEKREKKVKQVVAQRQRGIVVVLEDIHDPHNAEAIFRTCDALGVQEVYLIFEKQTPWNPQRVGKQSSSSANKWLTFHSFRSTEACMTELKKQGYMIVATTLQENAVSLPKASLHQKKLALMVGNEHNGLSTYAHTNADLNVRLPMAGMVESLNVSVATALFLYEIVRQRNDSSENHALTSAEQSRLVEDFISRSSKRIFKKTL